MSSHTSGADGVASMSRDLDARPRPFALVGRIQPYAWGGFTYVKTLTGSTLAADVPAAEWWIGAHPSAPSLASLGDRQCPLDALIAANPRRCLGSDVAERFGNRLPFLLKVLDVRQMLSIQAHPTKAQAEAGFAREQAAGLPLDAPHRTYRDDNHKPEAQVALEPFWMLSGFRDLDDMADVLGDRRELHPLRDRLTAACTAAAVDPDHALRDVYEHVMRLQPDDVDRIVGPLADRLTAQYEAGLIPRSSPDFWAARAATQFRHKDGHHDRGVLSIYLMNLVSLAPGQGTYLGAGIVHAYLEGVAVEIMANSDNVIRGGLTPKHVDVDELLRTLTFAPAPPLRIDAHDVTGIERTYRSPAAEFGLSRVRFDSPGRLPVPPDAGPAALIVIDGRATLSWTDGSMSLSRGSAVFVPPDVACVIDAREPALVFRAFVPIR